MTSTYCHEYTEIYVLVNGEMDETEEVSGHANTVAALQRMENRAKGFIGHSDVALYVLPHTHELESGTNEMTHECDCVQWLTDHRPRFSWSFDD